MIRALDLQDSLDVAQLASAIGGGDVDGAAAASDRLIDYIETFTRATLELGRAV